MRADKSEADLIIVGLDRNQFGGIAVVRKLHVDRRVFGFDTVEIIRCSCIGSDQRVVDLLPLALVVQKINGTERKLYTTTICERNNCNYSEIELIATEKVGCCVE